MMRLRDQKNTLICRMDSCQQHRYAGVWCWAHHMERKLVLDERAHLCAPFPTGLALPFDAATAAVAPRMDSSEVHGVTDDDRRRAWGKVRHWPDVIHRRCAQLAADGTAPPFDLGNCFCVAIAFDVVAGFGHGHRVSV